MLLIWPVTVISEAPVALIFIVASCYLFYQFCLIAFFVIVYSICKPLSNFYPPGVQLPRVSTPRLFQDRHLKAGTFISNREHQELFSVLFMQRKGDTNFFISFFFFSQKIFFISAVFDEFVF